MMQSTRKAATATDINWCTWSTAKTDRQTDRQTGQDRTGQNRQTDRQTDRLTRFFVMVWLDTANIRWLLTHQNVHQLRHWQLELCRCLHQSHIIIHMVPVHHSEGPPRQGWLLSTAKGSQLGLSMADLCYGGLESSSSQTSSTVSPPPPYTRLPKTSDFLVHFSVPLVMIFAHNQWVYL